MAVVDDQRCSAVCSDATRKVLDDCRVAPFKHGSLGDGGVTLATDRDRHRIKGERQPAVADSDLALVPAVRSLDELIDRQGVEELVCYDDHWSVWQRGFVEVPLC